MAAITQVIPNVHCWELTGVMADRLPSGIVDRVGGLGVRVVISMSLALVSRTPAALRSRGKLVLM